ncbi:unnamed protein product [Enterobius vermicularis]|uniref:RRP7 domain-containing protein n=1 Tax=Enterobius vermicularis TaxID=51028 RepID=A0A0N4VLT6_ENTVE|nr:unnamed protein product [Enterobius vermicularis]
MGKLKKVTKQKLGKKVKKKKQAVPKIEVFAEEDSGDSAGQSFDFNCLRATLYNVSFQEAVKQLFLKYFTSASALKEVILLRSTSLNGDLHQGYKTIRVRLSDENKVEGVLRCCEKIPLIHLSDEGIHPSPCGPAKFAEDYRKTYVPADELQKQVDEFMDAYDSRILEEKRIAKNMRNVPDDEGWITVTRKGSKRVPPKAVVASKDGVKSNIKKKKKSVVACFQQVDVAFYSFHVKESKLKRLEELRAKFEEDKKKISLAKAMRKFRPA